jgi:UDP-N-acetylglucosamine 4,6-dehydratase
MTKGTVLVTGATGFLGKRLISHLLESGYEVIGTGFSETGIKKFEREVSKSVDIYAVDLGSDYAAFKNIVKKHKVQYIVHAAALKHVGICEDNPSRAIRVNVLGSMNVVRAALECDVKNVIAVSTDKSIDPTCTYGMTKKLMEEVFKENNFGIFQGVNFLFSSESVLDVWDQLREQNKTILSNPTAIRYFCTVNQVCESITDSLERKDVFSVEHCYRISISNLQKAFSIHHNYWNVSEYKPLDIEKTEEELPLGNIQISEPSTSEVVSLFEEFYNEG